MGSYLRKPITDKVSEDEATQFLRHGASSMQGWRISQEDSHNCCPKFDESTGASLFAVYDGHGGSEVAEYASSKFPDFFKSLPQYKEGNFSEALEEAFLGFDMELLKPEVVEELKELAGVKSDEEDQDDEADMLCEEADMPLEKLLERYGGTGEAANVQNLRKQGQIQSPMIRPKHDSDNSKLAKDEPDQCDEGGGGDASIKAKLDEELLNGHDGDACGHSKVDSTQCDTDDLVSVKPEKAKDGGSTMNGVGVVDSTVTDEDIESKPGAIRNSSVDSVSEDCGSSLDVLGPSLPGSKSESHSPGAISSEKSPQADCAISEQSLEPSSSSGKTHKKRKSIIPEEGESESSFDEDEEDTDEDSEEDPEPWKTEVDEDDSEEDEEGEVPFGEEGEDEDEDEDEEVMCGGNEPGEDSGCTAVVALMHNNTLYVANAGDSRCVLCRDGKAVDMSVDHKPEDDEEMKRICAAGGRVTMDGRVNGGLNLSRALGDHCYKNNLDLPQRQQMITALPDIKTVCLGNTDEFMVLACDGIWNVMSSQDVVNFVRERIQAGVTKLSTVAEEMFDVCLAPDTTGDGTGCDNMTCIIVDLREGARPEAAGGPVISEQPNMESVTSKDASEQVASSGKRKADGEPECQEHCVDSKRAKVVKGSQ